MRHERSDIEPVRIEDCGVVLDDADDLETRTRHQARRHTAHISKALNHRARRSRLHPEFLQRLESDNRASAPRGLRAPLGAAKIERLSRDDGCRGVPHVKASRSWRL